MRKRHGWAVSGVGQEVSVVAPTSGHYDDHAVLRVKDALVIQGRSDTDLTRKIVSGVGEKVVKVLLSCLVGVAVRLGLIP